MWFRDMPWYSDLTKAIEEKIISPAREIFEKNIVMSPEEQVIYTSTHKNKTSQLGKTVNFLQDDFNMTEGKTDKTNTDALITNQEETITMISIEEVKILISNNIEKYKQRRTNIQEETNMVIENNISST